MADTTISPNMNLTVPTVGQDPGPDWATNLNASLSAIDGHDHTQGKGVPLGAASISIDADLPFNSNDATLLRSTRFINNSTPLSAVSPDLGCLYRSGADLYYNDGNGNQIRLTQGGSVAGASGTITGLPSGTAGASFASITGTFTFQQATNLGANMDTATLIVRYPGSYPAPTGNYVAIQASSSLASGYAFTLPNATPVSAGAMLTSDTAGVLTYTNVDNSSLQLTSNTLAVKALGINTAQIANNAVTKQKTAALYVPISSSSGAFSASGFSIVSITNQSRSVTTYGSPVCVMMQPDGGTNNSYISATSSSVYLYRDGVRIATFGLINPSGQFLANLSFIDTYPYANGPGTYTYEWKVNANGTLFSCYYMSSLAYEL